MAEIRVNNYPSFFSVPKQVMLTSRLQLSRLRGRVYIVIHGGLQMHLMGINGPILLYMKWRLNLKVRRRLYAALVHDGIHELHLQFSEAILAPAGEGICQKAWKMCSRPAFPDPLRVHTTAYNWVPGCDENMKSDPIK